MTFAALPVALLISACVIPPLILLYFLKLRRQERSIPSTLLWMNAVQDLQANAPFQRLKPNLLLFLQLLALLLLLFAIAQPEWVGDISHGSRTILLIDRSASMSARMGDDENDPMRLDEAKRQAIEYVNGMKTSGLFNPLSESERVMVISFSDKAEVFSRFTSSKAPLIKAIRDIPPSDGPTRLKEALELARAYAVVTDPENAKSMFKSTAQVILFSDGRIGDISSQVAREPISYRRIGGGEADEDLRNAGIVAFDAERDFKDLSVISVYARAANYSPYTISASLLFSVGDQLVASKDVEIPGARAVSGNGVSDSAETESGAGDNEVFDGTPGLEALVPGTVDVTFEFPESRGIMLGVEIDYRDRLDSDNRAFVVVPPAKQLEVALVNSHVFVLETALGGIPFIDKIHRMTGVQFEKLQETNQTQIYDVIILDDFQPERLLPGRYLSFGKLPAIEGFGRVGEERKWNLAVTWDGAHPVNHNVNYSQLNARYVPIKVPEFAKALVEGDSGPIITEINTAGINAIVVPFTARESNWPWDINFVFFLQNAVDYLGHLGDAVVSESFRPGESITARLPVDAEEIRLIAPMPNSEEIRLAPSDPSFTTYGPVYSTGLYEMRWRTPGSAEEHVQDFAVNMFDLFEGDIRSAPAVRFPGDAQAVTAEKGSLKKRQLWPFALLACLLVLMLEWWVYGRRAYI